LQASGVLAGAIDSVWGEVKRFIEPSIFEQEFTLDEIYQCLRERTMQLWIAWDENIVCACVTRIDVSSNQKFLTLLFLGGERFSECSHFIELLTDYAKSHECNEIRTLARPGFEKFLSPYGFDSPLRLFRKKLYG
jgi:hypothetical protein